jgi:hypothetical protein
VSASRLIIHSTHQPQPNHTKRRQHRIKEEFEATVAGTLAAEVLAGSGGGGKAETAQVNIYLSI